MSRSKRLFLLALLLGLETTAHAWLEPHSQAPATLELRDLDGRVHSLGAYRGRVVLINFWGMWCPPCLREMPSLQRLHEAMMADRPFTILAVNVNDSPSTLRQYVKAETLEFAVLTDTRSPAAFRSWGVKVFPTTYLLDTQGNIVYRAVGPLEWDDDEVVQIIESLLPAPQLLQVHRIQI